MRCKKARAFFKEFSVFFVIVLFAAALIIFPKDTSKAASDGLILCLNSVFPSLFPFFVLSGMMTSTGLCQRLSKVLSPIGQKFFGVSGAGFSAFIMGITGGYPVGAKTVAELYAKGICSKKEAVRLLCFCNNTGPAFILGICGVAIFKSVRAGFLLYFCHVLASVCIGIILKLTMGNACEPYQNTAKIQKRTPFYKAVTDSVKSSIDSLIYICGFVIFFGVIIALLTQTGVFAAMTSFLERTAGGLFSDKSHITSFLKGFVELTNGLIPLSSSELLSALPVTSFMLGWAGLSIHFQTMSVISDMDLVSPYYFISKFCHGALAAVLTKIAISFISSPFEVFYYEYSYMPYYPFELTDRFVLSVIISSSVFLVFNLLIYFSIVFFEKKRYNKSKERGDNACFTEKE